MLTTLITAYGTQDMQTQDLQMQKTGSDPVEANTTFTLSLDGSPLCFHLTKVQNIIHFLFVLCFQQVLKLIRVHL